MPYPLTLPFFAFKLRFLSGGNILSPLTDSEVLRINEPLEILAGRYAEQFQRKVLDKGDLHRLLDEYPKGDFYKSVVQVPFEEARDRISFPEFELEFEFYWKQISTGYWGTIPVLGVEAFAKEGEDLMPRLIEAVRLEFTRRRRLKHVQ